MRWDQPVTELFPDFKLGDEATTKQVKVEHLICACTGMPVRTWSAARVPRQTPASALKLLGRCSRPAASGRSSSTAT